MLFSELFFLELKTLRTGPITLVEYRFEH